ncbi:MAG: SDR family oxidoreductase [Roseiflexaceae bacterium]|nr:SDR family oxidoreductase [Roseiflexaceae bacterium]
MPTILVTGATGNVGREVIAALRQRGRAGEITAATQNVERARGQLGNDLSYVKLDFAHAASFTPALAGVEKLFLVRPPQISDVAHSIVPFLHAAKAADVRQVVFLSLIGVDKNRIVPHAKIEDAMREVDIPWTMLRPSFFMQNLDTTHRDEIRDGDEIFVPAGEGRTSFIDVRDIGAVGALALAEAGHDYKAYELTGAEALTYGEVAMIMSEVLGRLIVYRKPSLLAFAARWNARGHPLDFIGVMAGIYTTARLGLAARLTDELPKLLGRPPISLRQYVQDYRETWKR